ncbi:hypothetical protein HYU50_05020 [Candidatus Woesearchaeota archaeon]|nr:hypothetical protein [Candidatus Woesearchaeota archaeon]
MDIDDFLDKEIPIKREGNKENKEVFATQTSAEFKGAEPSDSLNAGKTGNLEALEKNYLQMWDRVSKDKFGWSSSLYADISRAGDEIKKTLSILSSKINNEKMNINRLISSAKNALERKNYGEALKLYSEIISRRDSIPNAFFEEKRKLSKEILPFYAKLAEQIDMKFAGDFNDSAEKADSLARDSFSSIEKNDIANAKNFYEQALEIYKSLPQGFLMRKIELGNKLIALYKEISILIQIQALQQQLSYETTNDSRKHAGTAESIKRLSEIKGHKKEMPAGLKKQAAISDLRRISEGSEGRSSKGLLDRMISRRLERANASMSKGLYPDARKNIESVLRLDPQNRDAKSMLKKMPT